MTISTRSIEQLVEVVQKLSLAQDMQQITTLVRTSARQLNRADGASVVLRDGDECVYVDEDAIGPLWKGQRFPVSSCISGWVMNNREPVAIRDIYKDPRIPAESYRPTFVRSLAMVPIGAQNPVGAIGNYWASPHTTTPEQIKLLQALAESAAAAMENLRVRQELQESVRQRTAELEAANLELHAESVLRKRMEAEIHRLSLTDDLTEFNNRRGFLFHAEQLRRLVHRFNTHGWLIYIDLDDLKQVNETLGHEAGDRHILDAAKVLRESFRDADVVGRIGGDEFAVFATGSTTPAAEIEERIAANIDHHNRCFPSQPPLSMSIGIVRCDAQSAYSLEDMIHQADAAMYIEKRRKRHRQREALGK
ncbi:sensor domain-containing diguanylate cyclase [Acidicapsa acidisoli]|uniref:sensor domain-containing diguanylate cyclase n=1 Tax=Acidicapsa acidisoli TaxID=1615681 RepID=UPI0021E00A2B|nr:diguanylate cyclase [Acidicapsa acidisoli]